LVLYLDAANPKSYPRTGTGWSDLSGRENNGTLTNGPSFNSLNNGSIVFDGLDDLVTVNTSSSIEITSKITISLWMNISSTTTGAVISKGPSGNDYDYMIYLTTSGTVIQFYKKNSSAQSASYGFTTTYVNTWRNYCITLDSAISGTNSFFYEDGILKTSANLGTSGIRTSSELFRIGQGWSTYRAGNIACVKLYNVALNSNQVLQNFNALRGRFGI
jgi:hypothetical protein